MEHPLVEYFRCPEHLAVLGMAEGLSDHAGYFRFGEALGYARHVAGPSSAGNGTRRVRIPVSLPLDSPVLPFDLAEVIGNLRHERYPEAQRAVAQVSTPSVKRAVYYGL